MTEARTCDLLVELGCEELPPKSLALLATSFYDGVCKGLNESGISFDPAGSEVFYTPRRLAFRLAALADRQPDQAVDRKGPALEAAFDASGNPTQAALGFARSVGCEVAELDRLKSDKGEWLFRRVETPGLPLTEVLYPILEKALAGLPVAKPMRWSDLDHSFVRPVHWLVVLYGEKVLPGALFGCAAGRVTLGHRIHAPGPHSIKDPGSYTDVLRNAYVIASPSERKSRVREQAERAAESAQGAARITESLLEEVSNILEWPVAIACRFEQVFLEVPQEALIASMEDHQKFFPVLDPATGQLTPAFIAVANLESLSPEAVRDGFERVIRPRLADARFFWEQDRKQALAARLASLDQVVFQSKLGTIGDKSRRIATISKELADFVGLDSGAAERAALLSKCDLVTQMVGEFPELQGIMGGHYARDSGEAEDVAVAIGEQYFPRFAGDSIAVSPLGRLVSVADRTDSLVGIFAAGLKPTGNKDPFALRRAALGIARTLTEGAIEIPLDTLLRIASSALSGQVDVSDQTLAEARAFLLERQRQYFLDKGFSASVVNAVFAAPVGSLPDLESRLASLTDFMGLPEAERLVAANKRIGNILRKSESGFSEKIDTKLMIIEEERQLFDEVNRISVLTAPWFAAADYRPALTALAGLDGFIEAFFDRVMVMDEDARIRNNRLAILARLKGLFDRVADLSMAG